MNLIAIEHGVRAGMLCLVQFYIWIVCMYAWYIYKLMSLICLWEIVSDTWHELPTDSCFAIKIRLLKRALSIWCHFKYAPSLSQPASRNDSNPISNRSDSSIWQETVGFLCCGDEVVLQFNHPLKYQFMQTN